MRAIQYERYGGTEVLALREVAAPEPKRGEVLVRVHAAALNPKDVLVRAGKFRWLSGRGFPKGTGYDFAGVIAALGPRTKAPGLAVGDAVFGMVNGWVGRTAAELLVCTPDELAPRPSPLGAVEAAALPLAGLTALQALRDCAELQPGQRVYLHGASGGVGALAVQIAKALGAEVTASCGATSAELLRSLGADRVVDYAVPAATTDTGYDAYFDIFGNRSLDAVKSLLAPHGRYVSTVPSARNVLDHARSRLLRQQPAARLVVVRSRRADLEVLAGWVAAGKLKPVLAGVLPLAEAARGHAQLASKRTHGKLVLDLRDGATTGASSRNTSGGPA